MQIYTNEDADRMNKEAKAKVGNAFQLDKGRISRDQQESEPLSTWQDETARNSRPSYIRETGEYSNYHGVGHRASDCSSRNFGIAFEPDNRRTSQDQQGSFEHGEKQSAWREPQRDGRQPHLPNRPRQTDNRPMQANNSDTSGYDENGIFIDRGFPCKYCTNMCQDREHKAYTPQCLDKNHPRNECKRAPLCPQHRVRGKTNSSCLH